ncbi:hypothetical protein I4U23_031269 [Adineta vaga]|nr:hypothetical protein I4U23_031269 [Adineta vaga]
MNQILSILLFTVIFCFVTVNSKSKYVFPLLNSPLLTTRSAGKISSVTNGSALITIYGNHNEHDTFIVNEEGLVETITKNVWPVLKDAYSRETIAASLDCQLKDLPQLPFYPESLLIVERVNPVGPIVKE